VSARFETFSGCLYAGAGSFKRCLCRFRRGHETVLSAQYKVDRAIDIIQARHGAQVGSTRWGPGARGTTVN